MYINVDEAVDNQFIDKEFYDEFDENTFHEWVVDGFLDTDIDPNYPNKEGSGTAQGP